MTYQHTIRDTLACSLVGWDEKPRLLPKVARPIDGTDDVREEVKEPTEETTRGRVMGVLQAAGGQWVQRAELARQLHTVQDRRLTQALSDLVLRGRVERGGARGQSLAYRVANGKKADARPVKQDPLTDRIARACRQDWIATPDIAERFGVAADRIQSCAGAMVAAGALEQRQSADGQAREYRTTTRYLVGRLRG
jgi:hypothetical protein